MKETKRIFQHLLTIEIAEKLSSNTARFRPSFEVRKIAGCYSFIQKVLKIDESGYYITVGHIEGKPRDSNIIPTIFETDLYGNVIKILDQ